uniref:Uncharacterized protein n=1 Tax=Anguilla anguilla TaxID=7936 RepID=A0A0E9UUH7_ANGAN
MAGYNFSTLSRDGTNSAFWDKSQRCIDLKNSVTTFKNQRGIGTKQLQ